MLHYDFYAANASEYTGWRAEMLHQQTSQVTLDSAHADANEAVYEFGVKSIRETCQNIELIKLIKTLRPRNLEFQEGNGNPRVAYH